MYYNIFNNSIIYNISITYNFLYFIFDIINIHISILKYYLYFIFLLFIKNPCPLPNKNR